MAGGRPTKYKPEFCEVAVSGVYALTCPETGDVRYIGRSSNIEKRYIRHCKNRFSFSGKTHYGNWIRSLISDPGLTVLEVCENTKEAEIRNIKEARDRGCDLVNTGKGGEGFPDCPSYKLARVMMARFGRDSKAHKLAQGIASNQWSRNANIVKVIEGKCQLLLARAS